MEQPENITRITIGALLTCHNRRLKTLACLEALFASPLPAGFSLEVFLVDDGSTDDTGLYVKENFPEVQVVAGTGKLFWNRGMILAWQTAVQTKDYDFFLWLNDDTCVGPDGLGIIVNDFLTTNGDAIICGATCDPETGKVSYSGSRLNGRRGGPPIEPNGQPQLCDIMPGNCVLIPSIVYKKIGMLDQVFEHAMGDFDYGLRAILAGSKVFVSSAYIGTCSNNPNPPLWCSPQIPLKSRIKNLYSPLGYSQPGPYFIYVKRHFGIWAAMVNHFTIHLRLLFPKLWL